MTQTAESPVTTPRGRMRGHVVGAADDEYDVSRRVWNGSIDRRPLVVARCLDEADVQAAVRFAAEQGLEIAVRGGAHSMSGASVVDDGIVIDLSHMGPEKYARLVGIKTRYDPHNVFHRNANIAPATP